ncbi:MAG: hypothetical protein GX347_05645 [Epulopiscium sp.]|mgnify:CR=1 FL=1|nr:hypothetical protein [Candidatus Epulonipiscium sp.]
MIELPVADFIEEVKEEIIGYEELGEDKALIWEQQFKRWLSNPIGIYKKNLKEKKGERYIILKDEMELFKIADQYLVAVDSEEEDKYWDAWFK